MDVQDAQDYLARVSIVLSSTIASVPTRISQISLPGSWITSDTQPIIGGSASCGQPLVLFILCILCIHAVENRFSTTWPLFPIEDSLFHPRMIRPAGGARHPGARASRPHPSPLATATLRCDAAGSHPVGGIGIGQAEGEARRRCQWMQAGKMAEAVPGFVRAGRPRSRVAIIP